MLYTIGHTKNYSKVLNPDSTVFKLAGGYAFQTIEDAQQRIQELNMDAYWSVYELDTTWDKTEPDPDGGWWNVLTEEAAIVRQV
jgi:hypothetical protein